MRTIFALASARSGTRFLYELFHRNAAGCVARHETYLTNPSMFGRPIYDHARGDREAVRAVLVRKSRIIQRYAPATYVETSHAFLKSYYELAPEFFSDLNVVRLIRNPLKVAKSQANRERIAVRLPFSHYRGGDGRRYFRWSLTGLEPIFGYFDAARLTRFQWFLLEWIEIENRAARFLERHGRPENQFTLRVPEEINDAQRVSEMFEHFRLTRRNRELNLDGWQNRTPGRPTVLAAAEEHKFRELLPDLPAEYLEIFRRAPYCECDWSSLLT